MRKQWYRLDNAALIFPAIIRKNWNNVFRVSATLKEPVDPEVLNRAIAELKPRFPTCLYACGQDFSGITLRRSRKRLRRRKTMPIP